MQAVGTKKTRQVSGLLLALLGSALMLGGCGEGIFFGSDGPTTTAAATDTGSAAAAPSPGATTTTGSTTTAPTPTPTPTPAPTTGTTPTPTPPPPASGGTTPTPPPPAPTPAPTPPPPAPTPSAGSIGKGLWASACQTCHSVVGPSKGANAGNTLAAIRNNVGNMGSLSSIIGPTEASQIATYAANPGAY